MSILSEHVSSFTPRWRRFKDRLATVSVTAGGASHVTPPEIVAIAYFSTKGNCAYFIKARNDRACAIGAAAEAVAAACEGARVAAAGWVG